MHMRASSIYPNTAVWFVIGRPVSGASMNPVRSIGPALVGGKYTGLWVYIFGPFAGAAAGAWAYNLIRHTDKTLAEITKSISRTNN